MNKFILVMVIFLSTLFNFCLAHEDGDSVQFRHMMYYSGHRKFPFDTIPKNAYYDALQQKQTMRSTQGMYAGVSNPWVPLGPSPGVYDGYTAGRCRTILFNTLEDASGNTVYLAAANGGLWKTTNFWESNVNDIVWQPLTWYSGDIPVLSSGNFCIDPNDETGMTIYYGTGEDLSYTIQYLGTGIYKTTNGGDNWIKCNGLPSATKVYKIAVRPEYPDEVLAALGNQWFHNGSIECGIYRSTDGGLNFSVLPETENLECTDIVFDPNDNSRVYCAGPANPGWEQIDGTDFRISTDGGESFEESNAVNLCDRSLISISQDNSDIIYVLTVLNGSTTRLYKSTDRGVSFNNVADISNPYPNFSSYLRVSPIDPDVVYVGAKYLYKSVNGGSSFNDITSTVHVDFHNMDFFISNNDDSKIAVTCDGGVWRSSNSGSNFENTNYTLNTFEFHTIGCDPFNQGKMLGGSIDNGLQFRNSGSNYWGLLAGGDYASIVFNTSKPDNFIGIQNTNVNVTPYYSTNGGTNYTNSNGLSFLQGEAWIPPMVSHPYTPGVFYSARFTLYKSENNGQTWSSLGGTIDNENITQLAISESNIDVLYASSYHYDAYNWTNSYQKIFKTTNGGTNWIWLDILGAGKDIPNRYISSIQIDPIRENEVALTLSGFDVDHIWKSTNYGANGSWSNISGNFEDVPVNNILINYMDCSDIPTYFIATDMGVFASSNNGSNWSEVGASGFGFLPNSTCMNLQMNRLTNKLRVGTFGIGAWEIQLDGNIYVRNKLFICGTQSASYNVNVTSNIIVCDGGQLNIPYSCTINMAEGKKITVQNGGEFLSSSGDPITFQGQSGANWGGIEFDGQNNSGTLKNITFSNTNTPITIYGTSSMQWSNIKIENCIFNEGPVSIDSRDYVAVQDCEFNYSGSYNPVVQGVSSVGSNNIVIEGNTINSNTSLTGTAISVVYGSTVSIVDNTIEDAYNGISISNSDSYVSGNTVSHSSPYYSNDGIAIDNCNSPTFSSNTVTGYVAGFKFGNGSPVMLSNSTVNEYADYGIVAEFESSPRMAPLPGDGELIYDAGYNTISTDNNDLQITDLSIPSLDYGQNNFTAGQNGYYIEGDIYDYTFSEYYARCNNWNETPTEQKFNVYNYLIPIDVIYDPYNCDQPGGGGDLDPSAGRAIESVSGEEVIPPQPIIVDRGNGFYDTINVVSRSVTVSEDKVLFAQGTKQELLGNYANAVNIFRQLIQSYPHTQSAVKALGSILLCYGKSHADSSNYATLRNHYLTVAQTYNTDTALFRKARGLAVKTLVMMKLYPSAITEYENIVENSNDSLEILFAELNIIETYMLIRQVGDAPTFTGRLAYLKPNNIQDGLKMIKQKYHSANKKTNIKIIPKEFKLAQNFPNPFNPYTTIAYSLPQNTKVVIKIYDILGRLVKELVNEYKEAGAYNIKFDGTNFSSGIYLYKIEAGTFIDTKKMVLVK